MAENRLMSRVLPRQTELGLMWVIGNIKQQPSSKSLDVNKDFSKRKEALLTRSILGGGRGGGGAEGK